MLHRAASNAYSWWWASHVRTKQSKWLEQSLHDMEDKVQCMLKIIEGDGDSFAKRAEMYYRTRPELINFVEESFRAYRALAERYEHIAGELQTANQTIATVFPEHAQIAMEDEDEDTSSEKSTKPVKPPPKGLPEAPPNMPKFSIISSSPTNQQVKKAIPSIKRVYSHKSNSQALEKIDKLQKGILVLQTEKEFIKGSYENGLAKYWDIENCITEMQKEVSSLQEEFGQGLVIEDDEARSLMAATALKSCKDALMQLLEKQERSNAEAGVENQKVKDICKRLEALKDQTNQQRPEMENSQPNASSLIKPQEVDISKQKALDLDSTCDKIRENFASFDVAVLAEKIDELVTKVNNLETAVSSQSALIERLRSETNEFHTKVETLEEDKETLSEGSNHLSNKLQLLDKELKGIQELNKTVEDQGNALQINFTEAHSEFKYISEELHSFKQPDASTNPFLQDEPGLPLISESHIESEKEREDASNLAVNLVNGMDRITDKEDVEGHNVQEEDGEQPDISEKQQEPKHRETDEKQDTYPNGDNLVNGGPQEHTKDKEDQPDWQKLFLDGMEDREKILLIEYTSTLRNYKGVKRKIQEMEKKNQDSLAEITLQLKKLESANAMKDEEIRSLHQKLKLSQKSSGKNSCNNSSESGSPQLRCLKDIMAKGSGTQSSKNVTLNTLLEEEDATANSRPDESSGAEKTPTQENEDVVNVTVTDEPHHASTVEEKFRRDIDGLLEENLKFWLRFSTCFHEIQKFQTAVEDLEAEYSKLKGKKKEDDNPDTGTDSMTTDQDGTKNDNTTAVPPLRSDVHPLQEHLREVQKEMKVWLQENRLLKEELRCRLSSLGHIQDEISRVSKDASENEEVKFTSYQAAKFQGEVLNMQQENNKVKQELESGVEHVKAIQVDIEKLLSKLDKDLELPGTKPNEDHEPQTSKSNEELKGSGSKSRQGELRHSATKTQVPLRSFLFGTKPKKHRPSLFTRIHPHSKSKS